MNRGKGPAALRHTMGKKTGDKKVKATARPTAKPAAEKNAGGRPTKYDRRVCDRIIELARGGKSKAQIRRDLGIHHSTWADWQQRHPEFSAAVKEAYELAMAWWEDLGMHGINQGMKFNATAYIFQVKNRFPREYRDRQEHEITGKDGGPMVSELKAPDLKALSPVEALKAFEAMRSTIVK